MVLKDAKDEFEGATAVFSTWSVAAEDSFDISDIQITYGMHVRGTGLTIRMPSQSQP